MKHRGSKRGSAAFVLCVIVLGGTGIRTDCQAGLVARLQSVRSAKAQAPGFWNRFCHLPPSRRTALAVSDPTRQIGLNFNSPVVGAPLFYDATNLNWAEAPPFGLW